MDYSPPAATQKPGDIVVELRERRVARYTLTGVEKRPRSYVRRTREAAARAERFARTHHVDVWKAKMAARFMRIFKGRLASPS